MVRSDCARPGALHRYPEHSLEGLIFIGSVDSVNHKDRCVPAGMQLLLLKSGDYDDDDEGGPSVVSHLSAVRALVGYVGKGGYDGREWGGGSETQQLSLPSTS